MDSHKSTYAQEKKGNAIDSLHFTWSKRNRTKKRIPHPLELIKFCIVVFVLQNLRLPNVRIGFEECEFSVPNRKKNVVLILSLEFCPNQGCLNIFQLQGLGGGKKV